MSKIRGILPLLALLILASCGGPEHPAEEEVKSKFVGNYCTEDLRYKMELTADGRYSARRSNRSAFGTGVLSERCEGSYSFAYNEDDNSWSLEFAASDDNSNPFVKCKPASILVWKEEPGYILGETTIVLNEPFDGEAVTNNCQ